METTHFTPEVIKAIAIVKEAILQIQVSDMSRPLYMSQNKAYRRYGEQKVKRWLTSGKVRMNTSGGKNDMRFEDLERCAIAEEYTHGVIAKRKYNKQQFSE
jgi:hypothetical protein